jgi:UDP:flavonoid glycosyltransferase YjiC (YdhE family)
MTRLNIAILTLYPDAGHIVPLLKIGAMLVARGHGVTCLLPDECSALTSSYGLTNTQIGSALSKVAVEAKRGFGARTILLASLDVYWRDYYAAIFAKSAHLVRMILEELKSRPLDFILVDNHQFPEIFAGIGAELGVPVIFHDSSGGLKSRAGPLSVTIYGKRISSWRQTGIFAFGAVYYLYCEVARIRRFRREGLFKAMARAREDLCALLPKLPLTRTYSSVSSAGMVSSASRRMKYHFATGLGLLEHRQRGVALHPDRKAFGPILDLPETPFPDDLKYWLDGRPKSSVLYVSFGSMVTISSNRLRMLLSACSELDVPVLWVWRHCRNELTNLSLPKTIRLEPFVPQWSVLSHPAVGACVTHGGVGTVLECLAASVPMVIMPMIWDQPYNAQFVQELGAGIRLDWWNLSDRAFQQTVQSVLSKPEYRERATSIAAELRSQEGSDEVLQFFAKVVEAKDAESWQRRG